ncbi:MAG: sulfatase [Candidatus Eisenbacteria bacterium]
MGKRTRLLGTAALLFGASLILVTGRTGAGPPARHLLVVTLDTTRADRLGFYGYDRPTSPNLDALAAESVVFEMAIASAAVTPVSHASILTGLWPYHHGLRVMHGLVANRLESGTTTLAEVWRKAGGRTAAFVSAYPVGSAFGFQEGFDRFDEAFAHADGAGVVNDRGTVDTGKSQRRADETTRAAIEWLRGAASDARPLFLWVHYFDPHDPQVKLPDEELMSLLQGELPPASQDRADLMRAVYDCEVRYMDRHLGGLFDEYRRLGLWENTIVAVVADHGEGLGDHDWWTHGILYQEQIRVPMLIHVPGGERGVRVPSLVRTIDFMPTLLEAAGLARSSWPDMDGESLGEAMRNGRTLKPLGAYSESVNILRYGREDTPVRKDEKNDKLYCLIEADQKLIYHQLHPERSEFYDLRSDPREQFNLAVLGRSPVMETLLARLEGMDVFSVILPGMTPTEAERMERLKSLGYLE